ncbi:MAG: hypothetical protein M1549_01550, partial [Candidatus Dependentiae bacterium]|nr:hypothetical protein [Candidatus Dependentiae bacterium]
MKHVCKVALLSLMALVGTVGAKDYSIYVMPDEQRKQLEICAAWATGMQFNFEIFFAAGAKVPDNIARGAEGETKLMM